MFIFRYFSVVILSLAAFSTVAESQTARKIDFSKKIEQSTPASLPQSPVADKLKSDAQVDNLKGKVKSVIEETIQNGNSQRERDSEDYFNETGNYVKSITYMDGYPTAVIVWGYIGGNRVNKVQSIEFAEGERPPSDVITMSAEDNLKNPNAPKDSRYSAKYKYRYNENGQLAEKWRYTNNGELWSRQVYNYKGNQREELDYGDDGSQWSQTVIILDKDGNMIERHLMDEKGKVVEKEAYTYEFDAQGNWIVQRAFEKKEKKGKTVLKPWFVSSRTITYYP